MIVDHGVIDGAVSQWAEAMAIPTPMLLFAGGGRRSVERVVVALPAEVEGPGGAPVAFLRELAASVADGVPVEVSDGGDWVGELRPADLAFVLVATWDVIVGLPQPPDDAAVAAVPLPTVMGRPTPAVPMTDPRP